MCELCAGIEKTHVELKKQEDSQWCGENIEIWKENNQAYLGYEGSAFPISFCPYCNQCLTPEEPLTVEELTEMDGEPVWVEFSNKETFDRWCIVEFWCTKKIFFFNSSNYVLSKSYGKTWLAYRHRPIEEEK